MIRDLNIKSTHLPSNTAPIDVTDKALVVTTPLKSSTSVRRPFCQVIKKEKKRILLKSSSFLSSR